MTGGTDDSRIAQSKADKRRRILDAALTLFAERGFHGTAVPLVAERAEVGAGTIYRFFESKEELVNDVFRDAKRRMEHVLREGLELSAPPQALFFDVWERMVAFARAEPVAFHFLEMQDHSPYLDEPSRALEREVLMPIFQVCVDLQERGVFRADVPPDVLIAWVWGGFVGLVNAERRGYMKLNDETLRVARDACWRAFAAEPGKSATKRAVKGAHR